MTPDLKPSWYSNTLERTDWLDSKPRQNGPFGDMLKDEEVPPQQNKTEQAEGDDMSGLGAFIPGLGG